MFSVLFTNFRLSKSLANKNCKQACQHITAIFKDEMSLIPLNLLWFVFYENINAER